MGNKKETDLEEGGDKAPLLSSSNSSDDKDDDNSKHHASHKDMKDSAFWLFMLFIDSVTMTVGNKVRTK